MWNKPTTEDLRNLPPLYATEDTPLKEKVIHMHFFLGGCDWYAAEYDPDQELFFGFVILNNDYEMAEWGYFSLPELAEIKASFMEVDRDLHFPPKQAQEIADICKAQGWQRKEPITSI
ncbi:MAG: DUF2958 domain-containing protein [Candidatus Omnitrophica bacterium]|nr:DUF2958 domain-containing protein [Candidatus Omnitrophota bacterium]